MGGHYYQAETKKGRSRKGKEIMEGYKSHLLNQLK